MKQRDSSPRSPAGLSAVATAVGLLAFALMLAGTAPAEEIKTDVGLVSMGKGVFKSYCTSCHGPEARGDGPLAEYLKIAPADLTLISQRNEGEFPFEAVLKHIDGREKVRAHGSDMPIWGDVFQEAEGGGGQQAAQQKLDALAHYLRSIQAEAEGS